MCPHATALATNLSVTTQMRTSACSVSAVSENTCPGYSLLGQCKPRRPMRAVLCCALRAVKSRRLYRTVRPKLAATGMRTGTMRRRCRRELQRQLMRPDPIDPIPRGLRAGWIGVASRCFCLTTCVETRSLIALNRLYPRCRRL